MQTSRRLHSQFLFVGGSTISLLLLFSACADTGGSAKPSSGTPVNPFTDPGGADTSTARSTGAQPRKY